MLVASRAGGAQANLASYHGHLAEAATVTAQADARAAEMEVSGWLLLSKSMMVIFNLSTPAYLEIMFSLNDR